MYLNTFRQNITSYNSYKRSSDVKLYSAAFPDIAINSFYKKLEEPEKNEGIEKIEILNFCGTYRN